MVEQDHEAGLPSEVLDAPDGGVGLVSIAAAFPGEGGRRFRLQWRR